MQKQNTSLKHQAAQNQAQATAEPGWFSKAATAVAHVTGRPVVFALCCLLVVAWAASGPLFGFSDTWQLVINTSTTIITFLMVFLIQNTQNRDSAALQVKLDELILSSRAARNSFIGIEDLSEEELERMRATCNAEANRRGNSRAAR
jgi:low affinity Fe/Cu permease